uniref:MYND-type domain-containing protein n=1 Tax=Macrostomum lignano TaxID=282301 RepID=A0A1I8JP34_9PLAT
ASQPVTLINRQPQLQSAPPRPQPASSEWPAAREAGAGEADAARHRGRWRRRLVAEAAGEGLQTGDEAVRKRCGDSKSTLAAVASLVAGARSSLAELQRVCEPHHQAQQQQQQAALASGAAAWRPPWRPLMQGSAGRWGIEGWRKNFARHHQQQQQQQQQIMQLALMQFAASPFVPAPSLAAAAPLISPGAQLLPQPRMRQPMRGAAGAESRPGRELGCGSSCFQGRQRGGAARAPRWCLSLAVWGGGANQLLPLLPTKSTGSLAECARLRAAAAGDRWLSAVPDSLVSSLRRQAQQEARAAVAAAEARAEQLLAAERLRSQRMAARIREEALAASRVQVAAPPSRFRCFASQTCWNCGRIASETCSGCSAARYCGSFCQHRDWDRHRATCGILAQQGYFFRCSDRPFWVRRGRCRIPRAWRELVEAAAEAAGRGAEAEAAGAADMLRRGC